MKRHSLTSLSITVIAASVFAVLGLMTIVCSSHVASVLTNSLGDHARAEAQMVARHIEVVMRVRKLTTLSMVSNATLERVGTRLLPKRNEEIFLTIKSNSQNSNILATTATALLNSTERTTIPSADAPAQTFSERSASQGIPHFESHPMDDGRTAILAAAPLLDSHGRILGIVEIVHRTRALAHTQAVILGAGFMAAITTILLLCLLTNPLQSLISRAIRNLLDCLPSTDGNSVITELPQSPIADLDPLIDRWNGIVTDVKQHLVQLDQARKAADHASATKNQFIANMSHELRTPLNGIMGMAELLLDTKLKKDQEEMVSTVLSSSRALLRVLSDILDLTKVQTGKLRLVTAAFRLQDLLTAALFQVDSSVQKNELDVITKFDFPPELRLMGDFDRLLQACVNILRNAVAFNHRAGAIVFVVDASIRAAHATLQFSIIDSGRGIPGEKLNLIFEPFEQVDSSATRTHGGSGVGLSIAQSIIGLMGGNLMVKSKEGIGSVFYFSITLPVIEQKDWDYEALSTPQRPLPTTPPKLDVLVAEDNNVNQKVILRLLNALGCKTTLANDGAEAVELADKKRFDLILMDIQMPRMDGETAAKAIRSKHGPGTPPIVALTANAMIGDKDKYLRSGFDGYLAKPLARRDLMNEMIRVTHKTNEPTQTPN
jgi:signal transduction histidine kinase/CheY-like chemotaxis protein